MSIYVHIPFCRSKCFYCGFYSVASNRMKDSYLDALEREIGSRSDYLPSLVSPTLYFGGGTPSFLESCDLERVVRKLEAIYRFPEGAERTIEMNPEDATFEKLKSFRSLGFNRLSIGVQSFDDGVLKRINRTHSGAGAMRAIELAQKAGFDNIGMDLIVGLPGQESRQLEHDLDIVSRLPLSHLSVYMLSVDSNSVFERLQEKGKFTPDDDDLLAEKYLLVSNYLQGIGFEHYEISNFAKNGKYAVHNTAYWQQKPYIGFGASAHSYDGSSRQWNFASINNYMNAINKNELSFDKELLSDVDLYNEFIMTNLRTMWGFRVAELAEAYPDFWEQSEKRLRPYIENGHARIEHGCLRLTVRGWLISDRIFSDLFV